MPKPDPLRLELLPAQASFCTDTHRHPAFVGGVGSGKTFAGVWRLLLGLARQPGQTNAYYGIDYSTLEDRPLDELHMAQDRLKWRGKYRTGKRTFDFGKRGKIRLLSFHDVKRIRSIQWSHGIVDELDAFTLEEARKRWNQIIMRMRDGQDVSCAPVTTPDRGTSGFLYATWGDNPKRQYTTHHARTADNPHNPPAYLEALQDTWDPRMLALYSEGQWVSVGSGMVCHYYAEKPDKYRAPAPPMEKWPQEIFIGMDFNIEAVFGVVGIIPPGPERRIHIVDEFCTYDTIDATAYIREKYVDHPRNFAPVVIPDATGGARKTSAPKTDIDLLKDAGFQVSAPRGNPQVLDRVRAVDANIYKGRVIIDHEACPLLDRAMRDHSYDPDTGEPEKFKEHPPRAGSLDDRNDAMGYLVHRILPIRVLNPWGSGQRMV